MRPSIWLTASFSGNGQACEMIIEKRRTTATVIDHEGLLSSGEVEELLSELVPLAERGKASEFSGLTESRLGGSTTWDDYENVQISKLGVLLSPKSASVKGYLAVIIEWKQRACQQK